MTLSGHSGRGRGSPIAALKASDQAAAIRADVNEAVSARHGHGFGRSPALHARAASRPASRARANSVGCNPSTLTRLVSHSGQEIVYPFAEAEAAGQELLTVVVAGQPTVLIPPLFQLRGRPPAGPLLRAME